jgi:hypothetical protein
MRTKSTACTPSLSRKREPASDAVELAIAIDIQASVCGMPELLHQLLVEEREEIHGTAEDINPWATQGCRSDGGY